MADPRRTGVPPTVKGLAAVSFFNDVASEMVYPLLPAMLTGPLGAGAVALGTLDGAADLSASLLRWWTGRAADRPAWRGRLIGWGYGLAAGARPLIALATGAWQVVGIRVLDRVGKGLRSPARDALIADLTTEAAHGRAYGLQRAADHLGAVLGALVAFLLLGAGLSVPGVIAGSAVPGVIALVLLAIVLAGRRRRADEAAEGRAAGGGPPGPAVPAATRAVVTLAALAAARFPETLLLLFLQDRGVAVAIVPLAWGALHVVRSATALAAGRMADRAGAGLMLGLGSLVLASFLLAYSRSSSPQAAMALFLALGVGTGFVEPAERVLVARAGVTGRGRAFGTYQALAGIGSLAVGLSVGWVYQRFGGPPALATGAALVGVALLAWIAVGARSTSGRGSLAWPKPGR